MREVKTANFNTIFVEGGPGSGDAPRPRDSRGVKGGGTQGVYHGPSGGKGTFVSASRARAVQQRRQRLAFADLRRSLANQAAQAAEKENKPFRRVARLRKIARTWQARGAVGSGDWSWKIDKTPLSTAQKRSPEFKQTARTVAKGIKSGAPFKRRW